MDNESLDMSPVLQFSNPVPKILIQIPASNEYSVELFNEGKKVGTIDISTGVVKFEGAIDESAAILFTQLKKLVDKYIKDKLSGKIN